MKTLILFLLLFCGSIATMAQERMFDKFSFGKDLPRNLLVDIEQDASGRLWIATLWQGIHLYDGKDFQPFKNLNDTISSRILELHRDKQGNMWIVAAGSIYQICDNNLRLVLQLDSLKFSYEPYFYESDSGMFFFDNSGDHSMRYFITEDTVIDVSHDLKMGTVKRVGSSESGLFLVAGNDSIFQIKNYDTLSLPVRISHPVISLQPIKNHLYIGTTESLQVYDLKDYSLLKEYPVGYITKIVEDDDGNIWLGNYLDLYLIEDGKLQEVKYQNTSFSLITGIIKDAEENIWIAAQNRGLFQYKRNVKTINPTKNLQDQVITAILPVNNDGLFWGTFSSGAFFYQDGKIKNSEELFGRKIERVYFIEKDTLHQKTWLVAQGLILVLNNRQKVEKAIEMPAYWLTNIAFTDTITYISYARGIFAIDNKSYKIEEVYQDHPKRINDLCVVDNQTIILSTTKGLQWLKSKNSVWQMDSVLIPDVFGMFIHRNEKQPHRLMFNTHGNGFFDIDLQQNKINHFEEQKGMKSKYTNRAFIENDNYILSSDKGINIYRMSSRQLLSFEIAPEVIGIVLQITPAFNKGYWVATTEGVYWIEDFIEPIEKYPGVYFQDLIVDKQSFDIGWLPSKALQVHQGYPPAKLSIQMGLSTLHPQNIYFQTKVEGIDREWSSPQASTNFSFNDMPYGEYKMLARSTNKEGNIYGPVSTISFTIDPYFYQTFWFRLLMVLVILMLIIGANQLLLLLRMRKARKKASLIMVAKNEARKEIARNFHDDLGNKIASILYLSQTLDYQSNKILYRIYENAISLSKGTKDFLWCLNHDNNDHVAILLYLHEFAQQLFTDTDIHYEFKTEIKEEKPNPFSAKVSLEIIMILKEAMTNSFKHSGASQVAFAYKAGITAITFSWFDNGKGLNGNLATQNGLTNMKKRAEKAGAKIEFVNNEGLEVILRVPII